MRQRKYVVTQFCFYDRTGIQKLLEKQARKGWMLREIHNFTLEYHRIEPKDLHFAVTYYPKASMFDPCPSAGEESYRDFIAHAGWKFVASNAQMQIFCNEAQAPVPIETDPMVELQNIHKAAKKSYLPSYILLLFCALLNLGLLGFRLWEDFTTTLANNANLFTMFCWMLLFCMECWEILSYFHWRRKAKKAAALDGSFVETRNRSDAFLLVLALIILAYILMTASLSARLVLVSMISLGIMTGAVALVLLFTKCMKKTGFSREDNRAFTILATVFIGLAVSGLSTWGIVTALNRLPEDHVKEAYTLNGSTFTRYGDELPLTLEDLTEESSENYSLYKKVESSILLDRLIASQNRKFGSGSGSSLRYVLVEVKFKPLLEFCLRDYLTMYHNQKMTDVFGNEFYGDYHPIDPSAWGADRAWQLYHREESATEYLLVYGNRIVNLEFSQEPDATQKTIIAEILGCEQNFENEENK